MLDQACIQNNLLLILACIILYILHNKIDKEKDDLIAYIASIDIQKEAPAEAHQPGLFNFLP